MIEAKGESTSLWDRKRRAGQRVILGIAGTAPSAEEKAFIQEIQPAGFVLFARNIDGPPQLKELNRELTSLLPRATPPLLTVDQEGGRVQRVRATEWPPMRTLGNIDDPALTRRVARAIADEVRAVGFNLDWAPVADVDSNPQNPVIGDRSFARDAQRVARHVLAFLDGFRDAGLIGSIKHFPGHGDTMVDSHHALPRVEKEGEDLEHCELVPFRAAIAAGAPIIMTAHVVYPAWDDDRPATLSSRILRGLLRDKLGFNGLLVSDDLDMKAIAAHFDLGDVIEASSTATVDLFLCCKEVDTQVRTYETLVRLQEQSKAHEDQAIDARKRLEAVRHAYLLGAPEVPDLGVVGSPDHRDLAHAVRARELQVLGA